MDYMTLPHLRFCEPEHENIRFLDAWETNQGDIRIRSGRLKTNDVESWLALENKYNITEDKKEIGQRQPKLRIICSLHQRMEKLQFGLSQTNFELVAGQFKLHPLTYKCLIGTDGAFGCYINQDPANQYKFKILKLICKTPTAKSIAIDSMSMCYDPESLSIRMLLHGMYPDDWENIADYLKTSARSEILSHPLTVPILLYVNLHLNVGMYRRQVDKYILDTETEIGVASPSVLEKTDDKSPSSTVPNMASFSSKSGVFVKRLHSYLTALAILGNFTRVSERYGSFLHDTFQRLEHLQLQVHQGAHQELRHRLKITQNSSDCIFSQIESLRDRAQIQTNLVFSLISQEENRISRCVAEDTSAVAAAARRDSSAMKTIAVLGVVFLPATFIATMFSMPFFSWDGNSSSRIVISPDIWIFWAVSLPLTVIVLVFWTIWWKLEDRKHERSLEYARIEKAKHDGDN